jgi:hypothetical protein
MKIGMYEPRVVKKGKEETFYGVPEGTIIWTVQTEKDGGGFDLLKQTDAEIISRLVRIEYLLEKINKKEKLKRNGKN